MQATTENVSPLEKRLELAVPLAQIEAEVENRLKRLSRTVKMHGFRPGKVPLKLVAREYGGQVRQEVLGDSVQRCFAEAVREQNLKVAGYPRIEPNPAGDAQSFAFSAIFEVYPEVKVGDLAGKTVERPAVTIGDAEVDKTIEILRKQRVKHEPVKRAAAEGDQVTIDYRGTIDGEPFQGGEAKGFKLVLGEGRTLKDFEGSIVGLKAAKKSKSFEVAFPADYHAKELAGKTAVFEVTVHEVAEAKLPEVDADFAKALGVESGDLDAMRAEIKANLEREVKKRTDARVKDQAMQALLDVTPVEVPKSLVDMEIDRLREQAIQSVSPGAKAGSINLPAEMFSEQARRRVTLGLILAEVVKANGLEAKPEQVRAMVEEYAQSYEHPEQVLNWYYAEPGRLADVEALALEENVVAWALKQAKVVDKPTDFDELMGKA